jgi:hypothetical protein
LEAFRGKMVFSGGSGAILEFLEWLEGLGTKDWGSREVDFSGIFVEFWGVLDWFRTYSQLLFET